MPNWQNKWEFEDIPTGRDVNGVVHPKLQCYNQVEIL
jgi:hypothetical protein